MCAEGIHKSVKQGVARVYMFSLFFGGKKNFNSLLLPYSKNEPPLKKKEGDDASKPYGKRK